jgi:hypothetical protein
VRECYRHRSFADGASHALCASAADVAGSEESRHAGLKRKRIALEISAVLQQ